MSVTTKLGLYAVGLVLVFAAAFGVGSMVGPVLPEGSVEHSSEETRGHDHTDEHP